MDWKILSVKWRPFCFGFNVLTQSGRLMDIFVTKPGYHWLSRLFSTKPISELNAALFLIGPIGKKFMVIWNKIKQFSLKTFIWKCMHNGSHLSRAWSVLIVWDIYVCRSWKMDEKNTYTNNVLNLLRLISTRFDGHPQLRSSTFMVWMGN